MKSVLRMVLGLLVLPGLAACQHATADAALDPAGSPQVPDWLRAKIAEYERQSTRQAPSTIWRITHQGAPAYYLVSPCCDQFNPLLDATGKEICSPSGGFTGAGDGKCPRPMDAGTGATRLWVHPEQRDPPAAPPGLGTP
ncbi:DUF6970 domain-containing protein [Pseudoxanthomonas beigongshangi]